MSVLQVTCTKTYILHPRDCAPAVHKAG